MYLSVRILENDNHKIIVLVHGVAPMELAVYKKNACFDKRHMAQHHHSRHHHYHDHHP